MLLNQQDIQYMSDLQARISPQQPQERFQNKTWIRPGFEKSPSSRTKHRPGKRTRSAAYGSDNSSHEDESEEQTIHRGSLMARLGMPDPGDSGPKSLLHRVEPTEPEKEEANMHSLDRSGFSLGEGVEIRPSPNHTVEDQRKRRPTLDQATNAIRRNPQVAENNLKQGRQLSAGRNTVVEETKKVASKTSSPPDSYKEVPPNSSVNVAQNPRSPVVPSDNAPLHSKVPQPVATSLQTHSSNRSLSDGELVLSPTEMERRASLSSGEEGEVRSPSKSLRPDKVRDLILPLVLQNAALRNPDTERRSPPQSPAVDTTVLSNPVLTSFAEKAVKEVEQDLRARANLPSKPAFVRQSPPGPSPVLPPTILPPLRVSRTLVAEPMSMSGPTASPVTSSSAPKFPRDQQGPSLRYTPETHDSQAGRYEQTYPRPSAANHPAANPSKATEQRDDPPRARTPPRHPPRQRSASRGTPEPRKSRWDDRSPPNREKSRSPPPPLRAPIRRRPTPPPPGSPPRVHHHLRRQSWNRSPPPEERRRRTSGDLQSPRHAGFPPPVHRSPSPVARARHFSGDLHSPRHAGFPPPVHRSPSPMAPARRFSRDLHSPRQPGFPPHSPVAPAPTFRRTHREREDSGTAHRDDERGAARRGNHQTRRSGSPAAPEAYKSYGPADRKRSYSPRRRESELPPSPTVHHRRPKAARESSDVVITSVYPVHPSSPRKSSPENRTKPSLSVADLNVPGRDKNTPKSRALFWASKRGLDHLGILKWTFEVNDDEAESLGLRSRSKSVNLDVISPSKSEGKIILKLACFPKKHIKKCIQILESGQELTAYTSPIEPQWPEIGVLIIRINEDNPEILGKTWLPDKLGPDDLPISVERFIYKGENCIEFVQLSDTSDKEFLLFAQAVTPRPHTSTEPNGISLPPLANSLALAGPITIKPAAVDTTPLLLLN
ncbi:hypothetical protein HYPSUDRAFT_78642 [Hypholoma sublateritium FD-334 SS-4]|uniref:Uncharacterized protein n=1 Tax=Hypholoma sublateritium (strain FD-334 SS-4) TaxID=945553 RepID=A0A0D2KZF7_HYPSF|nr:hypothetical protein HYPSUDRAFT_78642 [Hypholoma sublateritium FD-334 SS-4]